MGRARALKFNMLTGWLSEIVTMISGLILPRLILVAFGSDCNGLVGAITQYLGFAAVLRSGVGAVTRAALYKPIAEGNKAEIDSIMVSTQNYMKKVSTWIGIYILAFAVIFPFIAKSDYSWGYAFSMVLIIGTMTLVDNLFGIKYKILLQADQKYFVQTLCQVASQITTLAVSVVLIKVSNSMHIVKIGATLASFVNPLLLYAYVKRNYSIDFKAQPDDNAIKQRWDAFAQQMATIVNNNVGLVLLSFFVTMKEVSVYTVHHMVAYNIEKVVNSMVHGINSTFGDIIARGEKENLKRTFRFMEWALFAMCAALFSVTAVMLTPFVRIYTTSITDVNYIRPVFAVAMSASAMMNCMRIPYQMLVEAAGHFKQTRNDSIREVILNFVLSAVLTYFFGIIGVVLGTFLAASIRTLQYAVYAMKNILNISPWHLAKTYFLYIFMFIAITLGCKVVIPIPETLNYFTWAGYAVVVTIVSAAIIAIVSIIFNRKELLYLKNRIMKKSASKTKGEKI